MKGFIVVAAVAIAAYFLFFQEAFDADLRFDGQTYSHVSKVSGGDVTNHFYTVGGESFRTATSSIQIIEMSDNLQDRAIRQDRLSGLFSQYSLKPVGSEPLEAAGSMERGGIFFRAYSAPISVEGKEHQAFYLETTAAKPTRRNSSKTKEMIEQLKGLGAYLE